MSYSASEIYEKIIELRSSDENKRNESIKLIPMMANALGTARTSSELIPYIVESAVFTEEQWIQVLNMLGKIDYSKNTKNQMHNIFCTICTICEMESRIIRETFVNCFFSIIDQLKDELINGLLKDFILLMIDNEASSIRAAAIAIYARSISKFSTQVKSSLFNLNVDKLKDDPAINVRQSYANAASIMIHHLKGTMATNLFSSISMLANDSSYSVCSEVPKFLIEYMKTAGNAEKILEVGDKLLASDNWRVRCIYIASLSAIFENQDVDFNSIYNIINQASNDSENEVQTAGAEALPLLAKHFEKGDENDNKVQALLEHFLGSNCPHVKTSTATTLPDFVGICSQDFVCNALLQLTKDQSQEVKIVAIESLKSPKVPSDAKLKCLSAASSTNEWREKESIVKLLPELSMDSNEYNPIIIQMLQDDACAVRKAVISKLSTLAARSNSTLKADIRPALREMFESNDYQLRQASILAIIKLGFFDEDGMNILENATKDYVSNVRYVLAENIPKGPKFQPIINILKSDKDEDVRSLFN